MSQTAEPFGVRHGVVVEPEPVDLSALRYDPDRQINFILDGADRVPALKHSTGRTTTNTASQDAKSGGDTDTDHTED